MTCEPWGDAHLDSLRQSLVYYANQLQPLGLATGTSGNLSVRAVLGDREGMLITPSGVPYANLQAADIVPVQFTGSGTASWDHPRAPSSEWLLHQAIYQARPEAGAVVHGHPAYATVLAIHHRSIPPIHYMIAAAGGPTIRCAPYATYGTAELSHHAQVALEGRKACLLAHHGLLVLENTLAKAMWLAREVETLAQQYYMALTLGEPPLLADAEVERVVKKFATYGLNAQSG
ncbi:MAG: class II aldolase/adducin family protein [Gloeomargaritaceae cyanobacterium C42_A2020_066]|nr:class II aldolase/adducin family protein [Gloeomargaritaceae cyanobacterium C42_A2020_066]